MTTLGGRYVLSEPISPCWWKAEDTRLGRNVAVRVWAEHDQETVRLAGIAASLAHPNIVRVFDSGWDAGRFYTVAEYVEGKLDSLPLPGDQALVVAQKVCAALAFAHQRGVCHGDLTTDSIRIGDGGLKIAGFGGVPNARAADDLSAFAQCLKMLAGRQPPRPISRAISGIADHSISSASRLTQVLAESDDRRAGSSWWIVAALITAIGLIALLFQDPGAPSKPRPARQPDSKPLAVNSVSDFDPQGDGRERRDAVSRVLDNDPRTFWVTESYRSPDSFKALKEGVGLVIDLGSDQAVGAVSVDFVAEGCRGKIMSAATRKASLSGWTPVATLNGDTTQTLPVTRARWWLVWITGLAHTPGVKGFSCGMSQIDLYAP